MYIYNIGLESYVSKPHKLFFPEPEFSCVKSRFFNLHNVSKPQTNQSIQNLFRKLFVKMKHIIMSRY